MKQYRCVHPIGHEFFAYDWSMLLVSKRYPECNVFEFNSIDGSLVRAAVRYVPSSDRSLGEISLDLKTNSGNYSMDNTAQIEIDLDGGGFIVKFSPFKQKQETS